MADIQLQVGGGNKSTVFTLYDAVTNQVIGGVVFSNQTIVSNSNPAAANFTIPANPNMVIGQPISAGSGVLVASCTAIYTDAGDGQQKTGNFTITKNFTVLGAPNGATADLPFA